MSGRLIPNWVADSRIACALAPPKPNELTLARWRRPIGQGVASVGTWRRPSLNGILGFGVLKLIFGGIIRFSNASTVLMTL